MSFSGRRISIIKHDHTHDGHRDKERRFSTGKDLSEQGTTLPLMLDDLIPKHSCVTQY
jgi:hypothetical protein